MLEFFAIMLSVIDMFPSILQFSMIIEFLMFDAITIELSPILQFGPILALSIIQFSPIITELSIFEFPLIILPLPITEFSLTMVSPSFFP